jgi:hypothetical protein
MDVELPCSSWSSGSQMVTLVACQKVPIAGLHNPTRTYILDRNRPEKFSAPDISHQHKNFREPGRDTQTSRVREATKLSFLLTIIFHCLSQVGDASVVIRSRDNAPATSPMSWEEGVKALSRFHVWHFRSFGDPPQGAQWSSESI